MSYRMVRYHDGERHVTALAWSARKHMHLVLRTDGGIVKLSVPIEDERYCEPLLKGGLDYGLERGIKELRKLGRRCGITQGATDLLDAAESGKETDDVLHI